MKRYFSFLHKSILKSGKYPSLKNYSISRELEITTNLFPDKVAVISHHQNTQLTWSEVFNKASIIAANLLDMGLKKGDKVGMFSSNHIEWYLTQFACSLADLVFVTINPAYQVRELKYCLQKTEISAIISSNYEKPKKFMDTIENNFKEYNIKDPRQLNIQEYPYLKYIIISNTENKKQEPSNWYLSFEQELLNKEPSQNNKKSIKEIIATQDPFSLANIQFTSGTTGSPKGVMLSHYNILNNGNIFADRLMYNNSDIICLPVPFYHCFGMVLGNLCALSKGAAILLSSPTFNAKHSMQACEKYKATSIYGVPTMFIEYLKEVNQNNYQIDSLQKGVMAGSLCPERLLKDVKQKMGIKEISVAYGMTETAPISFLIKPCDSDRRKTQTVGSLTSNLEVKIVNEQSNINKIGEEGELLVKGYSVMQGYYNDEKATNDAIVDNWMKTGDLCILDQYGYLCVTGRQKDLIIRGGENISPKEIEDCLLQIDEIENVQVIGVNDEKFGEEICALIKLHKNKIMNKDYIKEFLQGKLAHFKIPKYVKFVDNLPITVTGKPQKFKMRQEWHEHIKQIDPKIYSIRQIN